ncbi:MAG: glycosyltransferase family 39 protein [bacterium]|nr:glycosyltransferase family 39 protein [bacterium]
MRFRSLLVTFIFVVLFSSISITVLQTESRGYHDGEYIFNGLLYLEQGLAFNPAGYGLLGPVLAALPAHFLGAEYPPPEEIYSPKDFGLTEFLYYGSNDAELLAFSAKMVILFFALLLGIFVFIWAKELFGFWGGTFALTLYTFFPTVLGQAGLLNFDIMLSCFVFITLYFWWKFSIKQKGLYLLLTGIFLGLSVITKIQALLLLPILLATGILAVAYKRYSFTFFLRCFLLILGIALLIFCLFYARDFHPIYYSDDPLYQGDDFTRSSERLPVLLDTFFGDLELVKPIAEFIVTKVSIPGAHVFQGFATMTLYSGTDIENPLFGGYDTGAKWESYLFAFFVKNPIPFLLFFFSALFLIAYRKRTDLYDKFYLLIPAFFFLAIFMHGTFYGGNRYLLPIYPFLFVFSSSLILLRKRIITACILLLLIWYVLSAVLVYPEYIPYFNEFVGMEDGYLYSVTDVDMYQDFKKLDLYVQNNNLTDFKMNVTAVSKNVYRFDLPYGELLPGEETSGVIIINAFSLIGKDQNKSEDFAWLREYEPVDRIGYSLLVYNITE